MKAHRAADSTALFFLTSARRVDPAVGEYKFCVESFHKGHVVSNSVIQKHVQRDVYLEIALSGRADCESPGPQMRAREGEASRAFRPG